MRIECALLKWGRRRAVPRASTEGHAARRGAPLQRSIAQRPPRRHSGLVLLPALPLALLPTEPRQGGPGAQGAEQAPHGIQGVVDQCGAGEAERAAEGEASALVQHVRRGGGRRHGKEHHLTDEPHEAEDEDSFVERARRLALEGLHAEGGVEDLLAGRDARGGRVGW